VLFAEYGILAAAGTLVASLDLSAPAQAAAHTREAVRMPPTPEAETQKRFSPPRP